MATTTAGTVDRRNGNAWTDVSPGDLPAGTFVEELSCPTATFCVLAGEASGAVVLRSWDGSSWHAMPAPTGVQPANISGLSCPTSSFCAAVGLSSRTTYGRAVAMTWNGSSWTGRWLPVPGELNTDTDIRMGGVSCKTATACVAVGNTVFGYGPKGFTQTTKTYAVSFNGTSWSLHQVPNALSPATQGGFGVSEHNAQVHDISCWAAQSCAVTGQQFFGSSLLTYINGTWKLTTRNGASTAAPDSGVSCTDAKHCVAVHGTDAGGNVDIWNGKAWHSVYAGDVSLIDISCFSNSACVAVGGDIAEVGPNTWQQQHVPVPQKTLIAPLNEISCSSDNHCLAISGGGIAPNLLATWNGSSWATSAKLDGIRSISCPADNICFAVGPGGFILRQSSGTWQVAKSGIHAGLVSCSSATSCLALGVPVFNSLTHAWHENSWRWNGSAWSAAATLGGGSTTEFSPNQLSCPTASFCLAVGRGYDGGNYHPAAWSWNGSTWTEHLIPGFAASSDVVLNSVSCTSPTDCMAVGGLGTALIAHWDGSALTQMTSPADTPTLNSVSCSAATSCVAVTSGDATNNSGSLIWNGVSWSRLPIDLLPGGKNTVLNAVSCTATQCSAVGGNAGVQGSPPIAEQLR